MSGLIPTTLTGLEPAARQLAGPSGSVDRYAQPAWLTPAGQRDRAAEVEHVLRVRQLARQGNEAAAGQAQRAMAEVARQEAMGRVVTEAKFKLHRANKESAILAEDNPVLQAQFAALDYTLTQGLRVGLLPFFEQ